MCQVLGRKSKFTWQRIWVKNLSDWIDFAQEGAVISKLNIQKGKINKRILMNKKEFNYCDCQSHILNENISF